MRDGTRDGCRGRMKGEKIHSVLISGLRRGYIVLGAFYLDVAAAAAAEVSLSLFPSLPLFFFYSLFISATLILVPYVCVRKSNQDKCVYFLELSPPHPFFHLNSHRPSLLSHLPPSKKDVTSSSSFYHSVF